MSIQLSANSFLQMLAQSGLLTVRQRELVTRRVQAQLGMTASEICDWLIEESLITRWQGEKLLQARYRGFFLGPYRLLDRIARGGMSTIYSARHGVSHEIHALKVLPPARTSRASYLPRFRREAEMTQRLVHPNIVRVFGVHEASDGQNPIHFMAMELLKGQDLFEIVNQQGPLSIVDAVDFVRQAALGLQCAHEHGLVHRDIKPGNLFLTTDRVIRILDLGLAQDFDSDENLTRDFNDKVLGTADYLAPEQATDSHSVDARADLYSLGCTLYFLLTGRPPFTEGTLVQRLVAHQTRTPQQLESFRADVPESLSILLRRMMARHRKDRIDTAEAVAEELLQIQQGLCDTRLSQSPNVLEPATNLQHHVETATGTSDDSWPDELWQAIAGGFESTEQPLSPAAEATHADGQDAGSVPGNTENVAADPLRLISTQNVAETGQTFEDLLAEIEARCTADSSWATRDDAKELIQLVKRLRAEQNPETARSGRGRPSGSKVHAERESRFLWSSGFLVVSAVLAILAVVFSQLPIRG